jgi:glycosyltransferase involved in cell wall biosynthesis
VPCYNEAARLDADAFHELVGHDDGIHLLFVDDGSLDDTIRRLEALRAHNVTRMSVLPLGGNHGKAEAVRRGLLQALANGASIVGYADADLATPVSELRRLAALIRGNGAQVLIASRVGLLGRTIERTARRHYLGRLFATAASLALSMRVYDTQCGAKLFRRNDALAEAIRTPFVSRWAFDVELIGRLTTGKDAVKAGEIVEEPLLLWMDVAGSKLGAVDMVRAGADLVRIAIDVRRRRAR